MLPPKRSTRTSIAKSIAPKRREKQPVTADECENDFKTDLSALSDSPQLVIEDGSFSSTRTYTKPEKSERRARRKLSSHQQNALEELATLGQYPSLPMRQKVAEELGLYVNFRFSRVCDSLCNRAYILLEKSKSSQSGSRTNDVRSIKPRVPSRNRPPCPHLCKGRLAEMFYRMQNRIRFCNLLSRFL